MRRGPKTLLAALVALLLACGLVACGGEEDGTVSVAAGTGSSADGTAQSGGDDTAPANRKSDGKADSAGNGGSPDAQEGRQFQSRPHDDSGGGAEQFRVKGGDNSVQEFGDEASDSERAEAAKSLHDFLDARAGEFWSAACDNLAERVRTSLEELISRASELKEGGCPAILAKLTNPAAKKLLREEAAAVDVGSLRVDGGQGFVIFRGPKGAIMTMPMASEEGTWKVAGLGSTPLG